MPIRMAVYSPLFCVAAGSLRHAPLPGMPQ